MSIQSVISKYPNVVWYDSNHGGSNAGTLENPYTNLTTAMNAQVDAVGILNGTHNFSSRIVPNDGTILVGESTDAVLSCSAGSVYGCGIAVDNQNKSFQLETLKVYHNASSTSVDTRTIIMGGNTDGNTVKIYGCILEMGPNTLGTTAYNRGMFGGRLNKVEYTVHDTTIIAGATTGQGILFGGSNNERCAKSADVQRCTIFVAGGNATLIDLASAFPAGYSYTFKNNILHGAGNSEAFSTRIPTTSSNNCFYNTSYNSSSTGLGTDNIFGDPQFVDTTNGDFRLRPASPCIGAATAS
jgi:hypothetical protein